MTALFTDYAAAVYSALNAVPALTGKILSLCQTTRHFRKFILKMLALKTGQQ